MIQQGACYIRVSTDDQTEFSPDAQIKALKEYARKNDIILSKQYIFIDEGISGKRADKRPAFMKMIAMAKSKPKPFDVILVHKFDRFARSREDSVVYKSLLKKEANIKVISITETIEDDKFAVILEAMLEAMAEYYSLNLAEEVKKGMTEKATRGGFQSAPSFGYRVENNKLVIVPEEAELIKIIFHKFAKHEMGMRQLAIYVNELGIKTKRGNSFENRTIDYILNNPVYIGKLRWTPTGRTRRNFHNSDSIISDSEHDPIIDLAIWDKVQNCLLELKELYGKSQKTTTQMKTWLKGLVRCGNCGSTLVINGSCYLQCNGYSKGACKISQSIKISTLEDLILEQLKEIFKSNLEIKIVPKAPDDVNSNEYNLLQDRLKKLDFKKNRIKEAYMDGIDTKNEYKENKKTLENERQKTIEQLKKIKEILLSPDEQGQNIIKRMENVYSLLIDESISLDIKYKTAHFLINKIIFNKKEKVLTIEYK